MGFYHSLNTRIVDYAVMELIENGFKWSNQTFRWSIQKNFCNICTAISLDLVGMDGSGKITLAKQLNISGISYIYRCSFGFLAGVLFLTK
ncbi:hypothetical protein SUGI_0195990 [Cryptomeria japonica]|nr:hypothetical protein SUGI_0195990 [Cryptomeria japonica]